MKKALIYSDKLQDYSRLCAGAESLGCEATAFVIGGMADGEVVARLCSKVLLAVKDDDRIVEDYFPAFLDAAKTQCADLIIVSATKRGKLMASRLAASMKTTAMTDVSGIEISGGSLLASQMYYGGAAVSTIKSKGPVTIITVNAGGFSCEKEQSVKGQVIEMSFKPLLGGINLKEVIVKEIESVNLSVAKKVVGIGRGISKKEDMAIAEGLAGAMGAEIGCSRPIAEGEGWLDGSRYIGVSGIIIKPEIYVAIGISGQIQHTIGINGAKTVIAVNKDKNAPIFKYCDYGIVGDLYKIVPALTSLIREGK